MNTSTSPSSVAAEAAVEGQLLDAVESRSLQLAEYDALRAEILTRMTSQRRVVELAAAAFGAMLGTGIQFHAAAVILIYPGIAVWLAAAWAADEEAVLLIGEYIRTHIEIRGQAAGSGQRFGWEQFLAERRRERRALHYRAVRGLFIGSELLTLALGAIRADINPLHIADQLQTVQSGASPWTVLTVEDVLLGIGIVCVVITVTELLFRIKSARAAL